MAAIKTTEVWIRLDENIEDLMLNGVPKFGDTVILTYGTAKPSAENILATRDLGKATSSEYIIVETNKLNDVLGG